MGSQSSINYLNLSDELHYVKKETDFEEVCRFLQYIKDFQKFIYFLGEYAFFTIDYSQKKYTLMYGPVLETCGYHPRDFLDGGLDFTINAFQKDDLQVLNKQIFPSTVNFLKSQPNIEPNKYIFETNYRAHNRMGKVITFLQKGSYITDPITKLPLYSFGILLNITSIKKDTCMVQTISECKELPGCTYYSHISTNYFFPAPEETNLTKREIEILKWMAEGLSSKQLADKFHLSSNTVMNHRKNMLRKTNTKNVAELIKHALVNNII